MRCLAVCHTELVVRLLEAILAPSAELDVLVESRALARKVEHPTLAVSVDEASRIDSYVKLGISPVTPVFIEDNGRRGLRKVIEAVRGAGGTRRSFPLRRRNRAASRWTISGSASSSPSATTIALATTPSETKPSTRAWLPSAIRAGLSSCDPARERIPAYATAGPPTVTPDGAPSALFMGASDFDERSFAGLAPDVAMLAVASTESTYRYVPRLLDALARPGVIVPVHWDDFERPLAEPPRKVGTDLDDFLTQVRAVSPGSRLVVPNYKTAYGADLRPRR